MPGGIFSPFAVNYRRLEQGQLGPRPPVSAAIFSAGSSGRIGTIARLNDGTPLGPLAGYSIVYDKGTGLYVGNSLVASGLSAFRKSLVSYRPNASIQPWMYVGDSIKGIKVNANGTAHNTGISEPHYPAYAALAAYGQYGQFEVLFDGNGANTNLTGTASSGGSGLLVNIVWTPGVGGYTVVSGTTNGLIPHAILQDAVGNQLLVTSVALPNFFGSAPNPMVLPTMTSQQVSIILTAGVGGFYTSVGTETSGGVMQGRLVQGTDSIGFVAGVGTPANVTSCTVSINLNPNAVGPFANWTDYFQFTIPGSAFVAAGTAYTWFSTLVSSLTRVGTNIALNLGTGTYGVNFQFTVSGSTSVSVSQLSVDGNYGPNGVGSNAPVSYYYTLYDSTTGAESNPSPPMLYGVTPNNAAVLVFPAFSNAFTDYFDTIRFYRVGGTLLKPTFVGSSPTTAPQYSSAQLLDVLDDLTVANNPLLQFDNFQPFPSIDAPHTNTIVTTQPAQGSISGGGEVDWVSGDKFNLRWAPGTLIQVGTRTVTLYKRPTSTTVLNTLQSLGTIGPVSMKVQRATLLEQRLPALWGPTDNTGFFFACGDPLRPGTLYFTKGNNPDSAPDTNQIEVTSPSEPLMNGCLLNGLALVFSTERAWWIYPNFTGVLATVIGTIGSPFYLIETIANRGLYARSGICTDGGSRAFYVSKDGIYQTHGGPGKCITDEIYSLFPHEGGPQESIILTSGTILPPDYANPDSMALAFQDDRLYFDYQAVGGAYFSLVYDVLTGMWSQDSSTIQPFTAHAANVGQVTGTLVGLSDGTIRQLAATGVETVTMILQSELKSKNAAWQHIKELNIQYMSPNSTGLLAFQPDQGPAIPNVVIPIAATEIKTLLTVSPNKFKLVDYFLQTSDPLFRLWTEGFQVKVGAWGRTGPYEIETPFLRFGENVGTEQ